MESESALPPFFPWGEAGGGGETLRKQTAELERLGWSQADGEEWFAHTASGWLCNPSEKVYFHAERNILLPVQQQQTAAAEITVAGEPDPADHEDQTGGAPQDDGMFQEDQIEKSEEEAEGDVADDESDFMLDLEEDLDAATAQKKVNNSCHIQHIHMYTN